MHSFFHGQLIFKGTPTLNWTVVPGKAYHVQSKDTLGDANWQDLNGTLTIEGSQATATDLAPSMSQRFYRISLVN